MPALVGQRGEVVSCVPLLWPPRRPAAAGSIVPGLPAARSWRLEGNLETDPGHLYNTSYNRPEASTISIAKAQSQVRS